MPDACVLDTHAWVAAVVGPERLPRRAQRIAQRADTLHVPAICTYELALLASRGRVTPADPHEPLSHWMARALSGRLMLAPLDATIAMRAAALRDEGFPRDPADALIYATAHVLDLPLITGDRAIHAFEDRLPSKAPHRAVWD